MGLVDEGFDGAGAEELDGVADVGEGEGLVLGFALVEGGLGGGGGVADYEG